MSLSRSKSGQVQNYMAVVVFLFVFTFISMLALVINNDMVTQFNSTNHFGTEAQESATKFTNALLIFDKIIVFFLVMLIIAVGVSSFKLRTRPVFMIVSFIMIPIFGFVSFFFNYIFIQLIGNAAFDSVRTSFPISILICTNLHWVALVTAVVGSIALYAKRSGDSDFEGGIQGPVK